MHLPFRAGVAVALFLAGTIAVPSQAGKEASPKSLPILSIAFTRHLDPGGTEGYRVSCTAKKACSFHVTRNNVDVKNRAVTYAKASGIADSFFKEYKPSAAASAREPGSGPPLLSWAVEHEGRALKGVVPWARELRAARPSVEKTRAVLELEYRLMELDE